MEGAIQRIWNLELQVAVWRGEDPKVVPSVEGDGFNLSIFFFKNLTSSDHFKSILLLLLFLINSRHAPGPLSVAR